MTLFIIQSFSLKNVIHDNSPASRQHRGNTGFKNIEMQEIRGFRA